VADAYETLAADYDWLFGDDVLVMEARSASLRWHATCGNSPYLLH